MKTLTGGEKAFIDLAVEDLAAKSQESRRAFSEHEFKKLMEAIYDPDKYLGAGTESVIVEKAGSPETVLAFAYDDVFKVDTIEAKEILYMQRIASILCPHNFPRFHGSFGEHPESPGKTSGTIRQRISGPVLTYNEVEKTPSAYPFTEAEELIRELKLPIYVDHGPGGRAKNFILGADGGQYYIDTLFTVHDAWFRGPDREWDKGLVLRYMKEHGYSENEQHVVAKSIERLQELRKLKHPTRARKLKDHLE